MMRTAGLLLVLALAHCAAAAEWPQIVLEERFTGFDRPVQLIHAGDGSSRLFVVEQEGRIKVISGGQVLAAPFLDISGRVSCCGERGLLGLAGDAQAAGSLEILSDVPFIATARSYAAAVDGSFGQFLPALATAAGIGPGEPGFVVQLARSDERYSNLGFVNLGAAACILAVELRDATGASLGEDLIVEPVPSEWRQVFDVLEPAGEQEAAWARIEVLTPEGRAWAYASIIDRLSRDPTTIPVQAAR